MPEKLRCHCGELLDYPAGHSWFMAHGIELDKLGNAPLVSDVIQVSKPVIRCPVCEGLTVVLEWEPLRTRGYQLDTDLP